MAELNTLTLLSDADLIAYYRMSTGALTTDSSGNSHTLTNNNTVSDGTGKYGGAADGGDGTGNKSLTRSTNLGIAGNSDLSVSLWIKLNNEISSGTYYIFSHASTTTSDRFIQLRYEYNGGTRRFNVHASTQNNYYNHTLGTSAFVHIVTIRDVGNSKCILYINGTNVMEGTLGSTAGTVNGFGLFSDVDGSNAQTAALLDDVAVFDRVLTPTEITEIYNDQSGGILFF